MPIYPTGPIPSRILYKCKVCGVVETVGNQGDSWEMMSGAPFVRSEPKVDFRSGSTGYAVPPIIIWHTCQNGKYGLCELSGIVSEELNAGG